MNLCDKNGKRMREKEDGRSYVKEFSSFICLLMFFVQAGPGLFSKLEQLRIIKCFDTFITPMLYHSIEAYKLCWCKRCTQ